MAFQGEYFVERYGAQQAKRTPPIRRMLEMGVPVGAGTDATRVSSYNPYLSLYWLITGKTIGGLGLYPRENRLDRAEALKLYTMGSSWFSTEDGKKGALAPASWPTWLLSRAIIFPFPRRKSSISNLYLRSRVGRSFTPAMNSQNLRTCPASEPTWSPVKEYGVTRNPQTTLLCIFTPLPVRMLRRLSDGRTHSHLEALGEFGLWGLGCDCLGILIPA